MNHQTSIVTLSSLLRALSSRTVFPKYPDRSRIGAIFKWIGVDIYILKQYRNDYQYQQPFFILITLM